MSICGGFFMNIMRIMHIKMAILTINFERADLLVMSFHSSTTHLCRHWSGFYIPSEYPQKARLAYNHFKKYWPFFALTIAGHCHFNSLCNSFFYLLFKVEFVGGPMCWNTRTFSASAGKNCSKTKFRFASWKWKCCLLQIPGNVELL